MSKIVGLIAVAILMCPCSASADDWLRVEHDFELRKTLKLEVPDDAWYVDVDSVRQNGLLWSKGSKFSVKVRSDNGATGILEGKCDQVAEINGRMMNIPQARLRSGDTRSSWTNLLRSNPIFIEVINTLKSEGALKFKDRPFDVD